MAPAFKSTTTAERLGSRTHLVFLLFYSRVPVIGSTAEKAETGLR